MSEPVPTAVIGYRLWQVNPPFDRLLSVAFVMPDKPLWDEPEPTAQCRMHGREHGHHAPVYDCTCGLYAWKTSALMRASYVTPPGGKVEALTGSRGMTPRPIVRGAVAAWGRIIEHELGFRAQHMRVLALLLSAGTHRIAEQLHIPVLQPDELDAYAEWYGTALTAA